jgi:hypothetical protein
MLCTGSEEAEMCLLTTEGAYIPYNRTLLVGLAGDEKCSHIFFVDHDMWYSTDVLPRLLKHDKDIVAAPYNMRSLPLTTTVIRDGADRPPSDQLPQELFRCDAAGTGMMLIKMPVFEKIPMPWFNIVIDTETKQLTVSEDVWFCNQARLSGFDIWCDGTIRVGHIGECIY